MMDGTPAPEPALDLDYQLADNLTRQTGRIFLTGTQALVRIMLTQRRVDRERGLNTAGFVSGYRGSPLGGVDMAMWKAQKALDANQISFLPGINEDMAATAVMGTQQAGMRADRNVDGVFAMWYGKGPGVDRAGDALHHGNAAGASRHGGVLVVVGDDHTAVSSSIPHASEASLIGWQMPIVHPASIDEYETFALWGWALSRHSGTWVAFKAVSETIESGHSFTPAPVRSYDMPADPDLPPEALEYSARDFLSLAVETRMNLRMKAVAAFARRHSIDRLTCPAPKATVGIVTVGKAHLDAMEALARLGVDTVTANAPVRIYKPGLTWPLDAERMLEFARGLSHILVIEEKAPWSRPSSRTCCSTCPSAPPWSARRVSTARRWCRPPASCARRCWRGRWPNGCRAAPACSPASTWPPSTARTCCPTTPTACAAGPTSVPAVRTAPRPRCPKAARRCRAWAATTWPPGWTATLAA